MVQKPMYKEGICHPASGNEQPIFAWPIDTAIEVGVTRIGTEWYWVTIPDAQCMEYLPTFTIDSSQM